MRIASALLDALAVVAPTECSGCGATDRALCASCTAALAPSPREIDIGDGRPLATWAALDYGGVARQVLLAFKDGGRTDAAPALARPLRAAVVASLAAAIAAPPAAAPPAAAIVAPLAAPTTASPVGWPGEGSPVYLATIPSTRAAFRRRGYHPVELVLGRAGLRAQHPLRLARQTEDQAGLTLSERARNRDGSLRATPVARGRQWVIVDDILTTGATLLEARRAILAAGGFVRGAAVIAHTPLRRALTE